MWVPFKKTVLQSVSTLLLLLTYFISYDSYTNETWMILIRIQWTPSVNIDFSPLENCFSCDLGIGGAHDDFCYQDTRIL